MTQPFSIQDHFLLGTAKIESETVRKEVGKEAGDTEETGETGEPENSVGTENLDSANVRMRLFGLYPRYHQ